MTAETTPNRTTVVEVAPARTLLASALARLVEAHAERDGVSRAEVAARALPNLERRAAYATISHYIAQRRWPQPEHLDELAAAFGVTVAELFR